MKSRDGTAVRAATGLWVAAIALIGVSAWGRFAATPPQGTLPEVGDQLSLSDVESTFGLEARDPGKRWFLVLGTSCSVSLELVRNLAGIGAAAECQGAELVPLVIVDGPDPGPFLPLLADQGFQAPGVADIKGAEVVRTTSVPALLKVDATGRIEGVASASIEGSWPPETGCPSDGPSP